MARIEEWVREAGNRMERLPWRDKADFRKENTSVIPAQAGIQLNNRWIDWETLSPQPPQ